MAANFICAIHRAIETFCCRVSQNHVFWLSMQNRVREKRHRLPRVAYRGRVTAAFTVRIVRGIGVLNTMAGFKIARQSLEQAFNESHGNAAVFVFMPDHLHLIVSGGNESTDLWAMVSQFKGRAAREIGKSQNGFQWQKDFFDHIMRSTEDYGAQVRYLLRNPVRQGLCAHWEEWPYKGVLGQTWEELALNISTL